MKLIADSGSTKTAWCLIDNENEQHFYKTQGINPYQQTEEEIRHIVECDLCSQLCDNHIRSVKFDIKDLQIYFYGAGCTPEAKPRVESVLHKVFQAPAQILVESDMLGAARALCGDSDGIVAILGTGSNSCLYDGSRIVSNVSPLGYILGDEGSGAYIGKRLLGDVLKRQLPDDICKAFFEETKETQASIIQKTYSGKVPRRFLAGFTYFCYSHREHKAIHALLLDCFTQFFVRNISAYPRRQVNLVGSVAFYFRKEIEEAAAVLGYTVGNVLKDPILGLIKYHAT